MPKKKSSISNSSLKKPSQEVDKPAIQQTKTGKLGKEIDDIFGGRKKKKPELEKTIETKAEIAKRERSERDSGGFAANPKTRPRKRTEDGLLLFTEEELGISKANAGDTRLCPFDCQCCF